MKKGLKSKSALKLLKFIEDPKAILEVLMNSKDKKVYKTGALFLKAKKVTPEQILRFLSDVNYKKVACKYLVPLLNIWDSPDEINHLLKTTEQNKNFWKAAVKHAKKSSKKRKPGQTCLDETETK